MTGFTKKILVIGILLGLPTWAQAQNVTLQAGEKTGDAISGAYDCTKIKIEIDEPKEPMTAAERAALMDKAFYESLSRFDRCKAARLSSGGTNSGPSAAGTGTGGGDGSAGGGAGTGAVESVASQSMQGTMAEEEEKVGTNEIQSIASQSVKGTLPKENDKADLKDQQEQEKERKLTSLESTGASGVGSGKLPDDIPPVDNDSVLEKQIRTAAMAEKDPVIKAKLWNEYRKYKGIPLVKASE